MRNLAAFCIILGACGSPASTRLDASVDGAQTREFTMVTWNIQEYPKTFLSQALVREIIERYDWDLIAIQEVNDIVAFQNLVAALPDYEGVLSQEQGPFLRNAILYRPARVRLEDVTPIFPDDSYAFPRDPLTAQVTLLGAANGSNYQFRLVVVHLKALSTEEDRLRRIDAIEKLEAWAVETSSLGESNIVFAGDFNDELTDIPSENVFGPFLSNEYRVLSGSLDANSFVPLRPLIDHIIITDDVADVFRTNTSVINGNVEVINYEENVSDHLPVQARFTYGR